MRKDYEKVISQFQIERDEMAYIIVSNKEKERIQKKYDLLNSYVDFNASIFFANTGKLICDVKTIDFILQCHKQITKRLTVMDVYEIGKKYRLFMLFKKAPPKSFVELDEIYDKIIQKTGIKPGEELPYEIIT